MGTEINLSAILDLERRIKAGAGDPIQLKRTRNSLLNISSIIPPEILAHIFLFNVIPDRKFGGLRKGCYNFLLVCHHWYEVACKAPEIWSFWGNTLYQWSRSYQRSRTTAPLDLVLGPSRGNPVDPPFGGALQDALRSRVASNSIRSVHLRTRNLAHLSPVLSSLNPEGEEIRDSNIESLIFDCHKLDVTNFLAHYHFPKLRHLYLFARVSGSAWNHLASHTAALTSLTLMGGNRSAAPTTSQLLSILASNPQLQTLHLSEFTIPHNNGDGPNSLVPLHHLKGLILEGNLHPILRLMHGLDRPKSMNRIDLAITLTAEEIPRTLGPYVRDCILRDSRFRDRLGVCVNASFSSMTIDAVIVDSDGLSISPVERPSPLMLELEVEEGLTPSGLDRLFTDFAAHLPREHVVLFEGNIGPESMKEIASMMPNIQELHLVRALLSDGFLQPDPCGPWADTKLLPSLRYLHLESMDENEWSPLLPYLAHQTAGGQAVSLRIAGPSGHICPPVMESIKGLVQELVLEFDSDDPCPLNICQEDEKRSDDEDKVLWRGERTDTSRGGCMDLE